MLGGLDITKTVRLDFDLARSGEVVRPVGVYGTFKAPFTQEALDMLQEPVAQHVVLYGEKQFGPVKTLWYRLMRRLGREWPVEVIAEGDAYVDFTSRSTSKDAAVIDGTFRSTGEWTLKG